MLRSAPIDSDKYLHFGLASKREEAGSRHTFHRHNEVEVALVESGGIDLMLGGHLVQLRPGRLAVYWGAVPHAPMKVASGTMFNWLTVPLPWFLEWQLPRAFTQAILGGQAVTEPDDRRLRADSELFSCWQGDLKDGSVERKKLVLLECEARLRRLQLAAPPAAPPAARHQGIGVRFSKVEQMARFVAMHYTEPLRIAEIAKDAGLHPDYAATLFRKTCGLSLVEYVTEHRVSHAQRLLATTEAKIVDISLIAGFGSASRFYSTFKKACARTPREYRREMGFDYRP